MTTFATHPFTLTKAAKNDLKHIALYTQQKWSKQQRNIYVKQFDDAFHLLANTPAVGKACEHIKVGYKKFPIGNHIIFYTSANTHITIVRILHKRMDVELNLQDT